MSEGTLKPCPFCGGEAEVCHRFSYKYNVIPWVRVECTNRSCRTEGPRISKIGEMPGDHQRYTTEAIAAWNTRAEGSSAEPVAWIFNHRADNEVFMSLNKARMDPRYWTETPLYAHPPAAPDTVALDRALVEQVRNLLEDGGTTSVRMEYGMGWHNRRRATLNALWDALK